MTKTKNPFESLSKAEINYINEFGKMLDNWHKLRDYIKPFVEQNKECTQYMSEIDAAFIVLPLSRIVIDTLHMAQANLMKDMTKLLIPPLKIECPKCKTVCWDVSELKQFLDPEGKIYGKGDKNGKV